MFDNVQEMLVEHLVRSPLIEEVPPSPKPLKSESRARVTNDRQKIFQAFRIQERVSSLVGFPLILLVHNIKLFCYTADDREKTS